MFRLLKGNKGQSSVEYATIIIVVIGALLTMQNYAKRGLQGRLKQTVDQMGEQYDPRVGDSNIRHTLTISTDTSIVTTNVATGTGFWTTRTDVTDSTTTTVSHRLVI